MVKKKRVELSWYRIVVQHKTIEGARPLSWDVLAANIDLAKQSTLADVGGDYEVLKAEYKGTKADYEKSRRLSNLAGNEQEDGE